MVKKNCVIALVISFSIYDYPHSSEKASERLVINNPRLTECSLGADNQIHPCVSERRDPGVSDISG